MSVSILHSCVSSPADELASIQTVPRQASTAKNQSKQITQGNDIADQAAKDARLASRQTNLYPDGSGNIPQVQDQVASKNVAATQNSIFSTGSTNGVNVAQDGSAAAANGSVNATQNSIFAGQIDQPSLQTENIPLPDAQKVSEAQDLALAGMQVPSEMQEVASADPTNQEIVTQVGASAGQSVAGETMPSYDVAVQSKTTTDVERPVRRKKTLADFFLGSHDDEADDSSFNEKRFGKRKTVRTAGIPNMRTTRSQALPGVDVNAMMAIPQLSDEDGGEGGGGLMQLASLPSMSRVSPNGLWTQTDQVDVSCFRPQLVSMLKTVEIHYGKPVVVTSGFRDPRHNSRAGGVRHSLHTLCAAADIQVEGVSRWELSEFLRSIPGRGGVGTYCHTESVHIDIGSERDWNWRCRRSKRRG